jgi:hypothetical protein
MSVRGGLFPLAEMMVKVKEMTGNIAYVHDLGEDLTGIALLFHLLFYKPLEHLKGCMIFFLDR